LKSKTLRERITAVEVSLKNLSEELNEFKLSNSKSHAIMFEKIDSLREVVDQKYSSLLTRIDNLNPGLTGKEKASIIVALITAVASIIVALISAVS